MKEKLLFGNNERIKKFFQKLLLISIICIPELLAQQVVVNLQAPPPYQMRIEDMWNLVLINQGDAIDVLLHGTAIEQTSGLIVDVTTSVFTLPRGSKRIRSADVGTVTINRSNETYQSVINRLSALPNGNYEICIEVLRSRDGAILGSGCIQHEVLNLSQVTLLYPEDNAILNIIDDDNESEDSLLENQRGIEKKDIRRGMVIAKPGSITPHSRLAYPSIIFNWLPPTPIPRNRVVTYRIKIVEMYEHQSSYDAMISNPLFFSVSGLRTTSFVYPVAARNFNPGRTYAWQVEAYIGETVLASSEIFTFSFSGNSRRLQESIQDESKGFLNLIRALNSNPEDLPEGIRLASSENYSSASLSYRNYNFNRINLIQLNYPFVNSEEGSKSSAVKFGFNAELSGETSNRKGTGSERKPTFGYTLLTPSVSLYGIPFGLNAMISSENSERRQNINSVSFFYDVEPAKGIVQEKIEAEGEDNVPGLMKFFSYFNSFGIGTNYASYTAFTMQGAPVSGLSFEFNPGWFYLATALQRNQKPIDSIAFRRDLYAGRIGFGQKDNSHIIFTGLYAKDLSNSILIDSLNRILTPNSNYVFGIDGKLNLFDDALSIDGEISAAMLTRDNRDPDLTNEDIPQFVRNIFQPKISSQIDYAYTLKTTYNNINSATRVLAGVRMIGPGYTTLGNPSLRKDRFEVEGRIDQKFLERQLSFSVFTKYYYDNLINSKQTRTKTISPGLTVGLRFKKYPSLNFSYMPSFMSNDATDPNKKIDYKNHLLTSSAGYTFPVEKINFNTNVGYIFNKATSLDTAMGYTSNSFFINENLIFDSPLTLSFTFGMNFLDYFDNSNRITSVDGNIGYTFFERWNNIIGVAYSVEKTNSNKVYLYLNSSYDLSENIVLDFRIENNYFKDEISSSNDYKEIIARSTIRLRF